MNLILFIHKGASETGVTFKNAIDKNVKGMKSEIIQTFDKLQLKLKQSFFNEHEIFLLLADSKKRIDKLSFFNDLLENKCIIIVTPDESKEIISKASRFYPRFLTPVSENYDDLCSVLNRMLRQKNII
jgi:hypothetical protein